MSTTRQLAAEARGYFTTTTRTSTDEQIDTLRDDAPEWVKDLVREAHGRDRDGAPAMLPDDYRYSYTKEALDAITDAEEGDDLDDVAAAIEPDVYTSDLTAWLGSHSMRPGYVDEARAEFGDTDTVQGIGLGQYAERREVFDLVRAFLERIADDEDDEADDD